MKKNKKSYLSVLGIMVLLFGVLTAFAIEEKQSDAKKEQAQTELTDNIQYLAGVDMAKCGEGKCGEGEKKDEKKADKKEEKKCGEGKCGEGKCGDGDKKEEKEETEKEMKCGEGKCGE